MSLAARTLNRWLEGEPWARERLAAHGGRSFAIGSGPSESAFTIAADGTVAGMAAETSAGLRLTVSPLALPAFLAEPSRWDELVTTEGDAALAATLRDLATTLPWIVEAAFAHALGPIVGKRVADAGKVALGLPGHVAERLIGNAGSFARDEAGLLAHPGRLRELAEGIDTLSKQIEALEARVAGLEGTRGGTTVRE
ncbi:MAG: hypothetical protein JSS46_03855 [Proteobacteria bacterium]|jgi:ubiquinone biosynthesis protein UbiJ|nr:hypothetical protein [Pseudomonadota bacterium]